MTRQPLDQLEDGEVLRRLEGLVRQERGTTLAVLLHLGEVEHRRLHLSLGFGSLFDYATKRLGYSHSAAGRRIQVARCLRRFPEALALLQNHEVNLTTLALVSRVLTPENKGTLLRSICNKTQRDVEALVSQYRPASAIQARVRPVSIRIREEPNIQTEPVHPELSLTGHSRSGSNGATNGAAGADPAVSQQVAAEASGSAATTTPRVAQRFLVRFAACPELMAKFEQARTLLSSRSRQQVPIEAVFEAGLDAFLDRHSPARRKARQDKRRSKAKSVPSQVGSGQTTDQSTARTDQATGTGTTARDVGPPPAVGRSRHIPADVRDIVHTRDGGRCTYVGQDGQRCESEHRVQVDHIEPFGRGGSNIESNLRLLCAQHNLMEAERVYGREQMSQFRSPG